jgi:hypothetical protein
MKRVTKIGRISTTILVVLILFSQAEGGPKDPKEIWHTKEGWRGAVKVKTCRDGTEIWRQRDGTLVALIPASENTNWRGWQDRVHRVECKDQ